MTDYEYEALQELRPYQNRRKPTYQELDEKGMECNDFI